MNKVYKESFAKYIHSTNVEGSNKASSYILALDWLGKMIQSEPLGFIDCENIWAVGSIDRLHELYLFVLSQARKKDASSWNINNIPKSYLQNGYCSAALKSYQEFHVEYVYEQELLKAFDEYKGDESGIAEKLERKLEYPRFLLDGLDKKQGIDVVRAVKVRSNQNVFRVIILKLYKQSCCITGLDIPTVNRASHIMPWADYPDKRLEPQNGLCLSATYDAAFDKNLISLDDNYRIIISKSISDHYTNDSVKEYFLKKEGDKIALPSSYLPNKEYLQKHRSKGAF